MLAIQPEDFYSLFGFNLDVSADIPEVLAALRSRLRFFQANDSGRADISLEFFQASTPGHHYVKKPQEIGRPVYETPLGEVLYFDSTDDLYINYGDRVRMLCNLDRGQIRVSVLRPDEQSIWLASHSLLTIPLIEILKRRGYFSVHAAGLCANHKALIFPGNSGAGKSTLTLALIKAGFGFLGDDMIFLERNPEGLNVLAFPEEIDVTDQTAEMYQELSYLLAQPRPTGRPKRQVFPENIYPLSIQKACRPGELIFPRITHSDQSLLIPIGRDEALLEITKNVLLTELQSSQKHLDALADLVRASECYRLETARDFNYLAGLLKDLVQ